MARLDVRHGEWVNLDKPGGQVFFVGPPGAGGGTVAYKGKGPSTSNNGLRPQAPLTGTTTSASDGLNAAMDLVVTGRGDTIAILPGSITNTAVVTVDKDDVTITGVDPNGTINPSAIVINGTVDGFDVSGANVVIEDLHFAASTAAATSRINAGAAGLVVRGCTFECGANDVESITIPAAGLHTTIENNRFYVTANGPDAAIEIEHASAHYIRILNNEFNGMNDTNGWDVGAINSGVAHLSCLVSGNTSSFGEAIIFSANATGMISDNDMGEGTLGSMLDPGACMCTRNFEADAVDQKAREFPTTAAS